MARRYVVKAICYDKRGRIVSEAFNNYNKTHPYQASLAKRVGMPEKQVLHAEVAALLKAGTKQVYKIKVERYNKDGSPANACPCPICQLAIKEFGVKVVEFTL